MRLLSAFVELSLVIFGTARCTPEASPAQAQGDPGNDDIFLVYDGLNESHSRDWAQIDDEGSVGVVYFQHVANDSEEGTLRYKVIRADGSGEAETVTTGTRLERAVLLFDSLSRPHVFVASSNPTDQTIDHYFRNDDHQWSSETIVHLFGEGGQAIYELSADTGPDGSFHLLILKTRVEVDLR